MLIQAINIPEHFKFRLERQLQIALSNIGFDDNYVIFFHESRIGETRVSLAVMTRGKYFYHSGNVPTLLLDIPPQGHSEPQRFLENLHRLLSTLPDEMGVLKLAGQNLETEMEDIDGESGPFSYLKTYIV